MVRWLMMGSADHPWTQGPCQLLSGQTVGGFCAAASVAQFQLSLFEIQNRTVLWDFRLFSYIFSTSEKLKGEMATRFARRGKCTGTGEAFVRVSAILWILGMQLWLCHGFSQNGDPHLMAFHDWAWRKHDRPWEVLKLQMKPQKHWCLQEEEQ